LTLRTELPAADLTHLANLCHDCRDCFTACMYTAPHEFDLNPPAIFAALRERTYQQYVWPARAPSWARGRRGIGIAFVLVAVLIVALSLLISGRAPYGSTRGSAYELLEHWVLVGIVAAPAVWSVLALFLGARRYWADTHGSARDLLDARVWAKTLDQAARLTHQSGGGVGCDYPDDEPSTARRGWHHLVSYGFALTFVSTISAAVSEYFFDSLPPYAYLSVPVITGTIGGVAMTIGCIGLLAQKRRSDPGPCAVPITASSGRC
jgi:citrate/tricarballylate utilization protein